MKAVIDTTRPDIAMIELDEERLDRMREAPPPDPVPEHLQPITISAPAQGSAPAFKLETSCQRAVWNAEVAGERITGEVVFDADDEYGISEENNAYLGRGDFVSLVRRGSENGEFAPFALKAHRAASAGASAVICADVEERLPAHRIGAATFWGDVRIAWKTKSCTFPSIPVLLLPKADGEKLMELCKSGRCLTADFTVKSDPYPRRTLAKKLCQGFALIFSGIGVLYGIIQCFAVEVGGEFLAAEQAAREIGIRCVCIDVDLNRFWSRLGWAILPLPANLLNSLLSWLAFPRLFFQFVFPPFGTIDVLGSMVLHGKSFPLKTWVAFILAGFCASFVTNGVLRLLGSGVEAGAEGAGMVKEEHRDEVQAWIMLGIELYILPQVYDAVAASRDEAMYRSMVSKCKEFTVARTVVVVGAGHANGILQRVHSLGL